VQVRAVLGTVLGAIHVYAHVQLEQSDMGALNIKRNHFETATDKNLAPLFPAKLMSGRGTYRDLSIGGVAECAGSQAPFLS
jgi:hypothetical protein